MLNIFFFAALREQLGCASYQLPLDGQVLTVREVLNTLIALSPRFEKGLAHTEVLCAVNKKLVPLTHPVTAKDELAFFPPVTGG